MITVEIRCAACNKYQNYTYKPSIKGDMLLKHDIPCDCGHPNFDLRTTRTKQD